MRVALSSAGRSALRVHAALAAQVLATAALVVFEETRGGPLAARIAAIGGDPRAPGADEIMGEVTVFALLVLAVPATWIVAAVAYLSWLGRVRREAVRVWLIPVVNLVAPPFALHAAWVAAGAPRGRRRAWLALLTCWWLSWLAAVALTVLPPLTRDAGLTGLGPATLAVTALAALLCAAVVHELTHGTARRPAGSRLPLAPPRRPAALRWTPRRAVPPAVRPAAAPVASPVTSPVTGPGDGHGQVAGG